MNNRTRNKLIGIIAILLIMIIFFPYMGKKSAFEKEKEIALTTLAAEYGEPPEEAIKTRKTHTVPLSEPDIPLLNTPTLTKSLPTETTSKPDKPMVKEVTPSKARTELKRRIADMKNYAIQLVALKNQQKIEELLALLRLHNYHAYVDKRDEEQIQRLFVGPYSSKEQAESTILDLHNLTKLKGIIITK